MEHEGYARVANWVSKDPDNEPFLYRKFDELASLNLLYLQTEMLELEDRIRESNKVVAKGDMELKQSAEEWEVFIRLRDSSNLPHTRPEVVSEVRRRMGLISELRRTIKEYRKQVQVPTTLKPIQAWRSVNSIPPFRAIDEALLLQNKILSLSCPESRVLNAFRQWFRGPPIGSYGRRLSPMLLGKAATFLDSEQDLVALKQPAEIDYISRFLRTHWRTTVSLNHIAFILDVLLTPVQVEPLSGQNGHVGRFSEARISLTVNVIAILLAAIFLVGSIVGLHFVQTDSVRLTMLSLFTLGFAACVALITNAKRSEIFAATAA